MTPARPGKGRETTAMWAVGTPRPLTVRVDADGLPVAVTRHAQRGRRPVPVAVESIEEVWRVAEAWWREEPERRTYYRLLLADGRLLTLFHDDRHDSWHEQPYGASDAHR